MSCYAFSMSDEVSTTNGGLIMIMAKNRPYGDGHRIGAVKGRSQVLNPKTGLYVKRGPDGKFMDVKTTGGKFKGVTMEP